jgi:hypothetical protein
MIAKTTFIICYKCTNSVKIYVITNDSTKFHWIKTVQLIFVATTYKNSFLVTQLVRSMNVC